MDDEIVVIPRDFYIAEVRLEICSLCVEMFNDVTDSTASNSTHSNRLTLYGLIYLECNLNNWWRFCLSVESSDYLMGRKGDCPKKSLANNLSPYVLPWLMRGKYGVMLDEVQRKMIKKRYRWEDFLSFPVKVSGHAKLEVFDEEFTNMKSPLSPPKTELGKMCFDTFGEEKYISFFQDRPIDGNGRFVFDSYWLRKEIELRFGPQLQHIYSSLGV